MQLDVVAAFILMSFNCFACFRIPLPTATELGIRPAATTIPRTTATTETTNATVF